MIRGALGWALERHVHAAPSPGWPGLGEKVNFTDAVFAPQKAWDCQQAGSPWHLQMQDVTTSWQPGQMLHGSFILFGSWPGWMQGLWQDCFEQAVATGFGNHAPQFSVTAWDVVDQQWLLPPVQPIQLTMRTLSAARLQDRGQECTALEPAAIARSVLRRWRQLHLQLTGADPVMPLPYPELSRACDDLHSPRAVDASAAPIRRWSNRQDRAVTMPGLTGTVTISGPALSTLAPILAQAPLLHIGKQPNFGLGMVECEWTTEKPLANKQSVMKDNQ